MSDLIFLFSFVRESMTEATVEDGRMEEEEEGDLSEEEEMMAQGEEEIEEEIEEGESEKKESLLAKAKKITKNDKSSKAYKFTVYKDGVLRKVLKPDEMIEYMERKNFAPRKRGVSKKALVHLGVQNAGVKKRQRASSTAAIVPPQSVGEVKKKRTLSQKQLEALAAGRQKKAALLKAGRGGGGRKSVMVAPQQQNLSLLQSLYPDIDFNELIKEERRKKLVQAIESAGLY